MPNTRTPSRRNAAYLNAKFFMVAILTLLLTQTIVSGQTLMSDILFSGAVLVTPQRMFYARNYGGKCLDFGAPPTSKRLTCVLIRLQWNDCATASPRRNQ